VSIITGLDFPLECETGTWDWKVRLTKVVQDRTEAPRSIYSLNYFAKLASWAVEATLPRVSRG